jgi:FkbM family methyltransferase
MRHSILHTAGNVVWVARNHRRAAVPLLWTYSRLKLREALASRPRGNGLRRTRILDMDVTFFDHYWLVEMFEEIFLRRHYYFESDSPHPLIVDVGSNIGLAILFFKRLHPASKVIAFEPDPETFAVLEKNVRDNALEGVRARNEAVYDGSERLHLYGDCETPGSPQQTMRSGRLTGGIRSVPASRLSDHITEAVDFLKIDVEGAEGVVMEELEESGKLELVRRLAVEHHHHLDPEEDGLSRLLAALERNGFGYQLEARLASFTSPPGQYQNVLVFGYRKKAPAASPGAR